jgi:hypothetical protein
MTLAEKIKILDKLHGVIMAARVSCEWIYHMCQSKKWRKDTYLQMLKFLSPNAKKFQAFRWNPPLEKN